MADEGALSPASDDPRHPLLGFRGRLRLYLLAWILPGVLLGYLLASGGYAAWRAAALAAPLTLVYAFACLPIWYTCRVLPLRSDSVLGAHLTAAVVGGGLWGLLAKLLAFAYGWPQPPRAATVVVWALGVLLYLLAAAGYYVALERERSTLADRRAREAHALAREAELRALKAQINPHFLYNSLNSISALTSTDAARARQMCVQLGDFFRRSLALGAAGDTLSPLREELALVAAYLAIEQVRFGARLQWEEQVTPEALAVGVPPLLLQPLVENAVVHGISPLLAGGCIGLQAETRAGWLHLTLTNPYDPDEVRSGTGVGLANVRARLRAIFGDRGRLSTEASDGHFQVMLALPMEES